MKSYKTIANDDIIEARVYKPVKRTITILPEKTYFLQFPNIIAVKVRLEVTPSHYWDIYEPYYCYEPSVFLAVNMVHDKFVYNIPLPQVNYVANKLGVCLNHKNGHVFCKHWTTLDDMMDWFWFTLFHPDGNIEYSRFSSFHNWSTLDLAGVIDLLKHSDPRCTIDDYLEELREASRKVAKICKGEKNEYKTTVQDGDSC